MPTTNEKNIDNFIKMIDDLKIKLGNKNRVDEVATFGDFDPETDVEVFEFSNADPMTLNSKKNYVRWFPHREVGNRPDLDGTDEKRSHTDPHELEQYGAYHFEIFFFPNLRKISTSDLFNEEQSTALKEKLTEKNIKQKQLDAEGGIASGIQSIWESVKFLGNVFAAGANTAIQDIDDLYKNLSSDQFIEVPKDRDVVTTPIRQFEGQSNLKCDIYLPLNKYTISKNSGISIEKDQQTNIAVGMLKYGASAIKNYLGPLAAPANRTGLTFRDYIAPRVTQGNLDTISLAWEMAPRNRVELNHILDIIRFFNSASVPLYVRGYPFYMMPPYVNMEAITTNHTDKSKVQIRPKSQYYITDITINASGDADGSVLLTPDGYPMFITLEVKLLKADINSFHDLFEFPLM